MFDSKASAYTLAAIMQYAGIVDSTAKYWHYTAEASEFHHADFCDVSCLLWLFSSLARAPGSLAGGFLVAVAGRAPWLFCCLV